MREYYYLVVVFIIRKSVAILTKGVEYFVRRTIIAAILAAEISREPFRRPAGIVLMV